MKLVNLVQHPVSISVVPRLAESPSDGGRSPSDEGLLGSEKEIVVENVREMVISGRHPNNLKIQLEADAGGTTGLDDGGSGPGTLTDPSEGDGDRGHKGKGLLVHSRVDGVVSVEEFDLENPIDVEELKDGNRLAVYASRLRVELKTVGGELRVVIVRLRPVSLRQAKRLLQGFLG